MVADCTASGCALRLRVAGLHLFGKRDRQDTILVLRGHLRAVDCVGERDGPLEVTFESLLADDLARRFTAFGFVIGFAADTEDVTLHLDADIALAGSGHIHSDEVSILGFFDVDARRKRATFEIGRASWRARV